MREFFYVTGGTLNPGAPSYVERRADSELFESILAGDFCYVLTSRQTGKSSLMARTAKRLKEADVRSAIVDLTQIGGERGDQAAEQWYFGIANKIHQQLEIAEPLRPWWQERSDLSPVQRLTDFFREHVLTHCPGQVVVFVDEIDSTIGLPFADDFFTALRACFNARATDPAFERLTFVLLGVATPDQLIQDPARTPFNIGRGIDLTDFNLDEAGRLAPGLHADPGEAVRRLERVLYWTGGHPYLTQALCRAVREMGETGTAQEAVDPRVEELFLTSRAQREETNLRHSRARLERPGPEGRRLLQLYRRVRQGKPVPDQPTSPLFAQLKLTGVVKATDEGRLAVRNRVYEAVFTAEWAKAAMPTDRSRQLAAATLAASLAGVLVWYAAFQPRPYEQAFQAAIEEDGYTGVLRAYTALRANPFSRSRATELMQQFWEQRTLRYAQAGARDESLLSCLQGLSLGDSERLRKQTRNLVGEDYERLQLALRHTGRVTAVAFSPNGQTLATGSGDKTSLIWNARSGRPLTPPLREFWPVVAVAFSPDGRTLSSAFSDGTALLRDARSGKPLATFLQHQDSVLAFAFSPDGRALATGFSDGTALLRNARSGKPLAPPLQHQDSVLTVAFSPDGRIVATGSRDKTARLWDARSGNPLAPPLQHKDSVLAVAFSPDGRTLVTGSRDNIARLWDAGSGKLLAPLLRHEGTIYAVAFSPDGRTVATGSTDNTARLWDVGSGKPLAPPLQHQDSVLAVVFSPDGRTVATGSTDNTARLWNARSGKPLAPPLQFAGAILVAVFSPDGRTVATGSRDTARLRDARSGKLLAPPLHQSRVFAVAFSPDGRTLAAGYGDNTARLWDATGRTVGPPLQHQGPVFAVAFSPDGRTLATGSRDGTARLWNAHSGKRRLPPFQHQNTVLAIAFSPDGRTLVTGAADKTARLWEARTGKPLAPPLRHEFPVTAVAFSPDGLTLATGSLDKKARLWDARNGKPLAPPRRLQGSVQDIAFNPNGKGFFVATDHWLNTYSWDGKKAIPQSSQLLHGFWKKGFRFPSDCDRCLEVVLGDIGNSFHLETLNLDAPTDPPIEGDPKELLEKWQGRLGLTFDEQMKLVPR